MDNSTTRFCPVCHCQFCFFVRGFSNNAENQSRSFTPPPPHAPHSCKVTVRQLMTKGPDRARSYHEDLSWCTLSNTNQFNNWRPFFMRLSCYNPEFRHNIVKVAVVPRGDSQVDSQTTLTILWRNSLSITEQTHEKMPASICFLR